MVIARIQAETQANLARKRWANSKLPFPSEPVRIEYPSSVGSTVEFVAVTTPTKHWKTFKGEPIPFPAGEDPAHIAKVREAIPPQLAHLEGFFSKKQANSLPFLRPGYDVIIELTGETPKNSLAVYRTPVQFLPLEKEFVEQLLENDFIEPCMDLKAALVLFAPKPYLTERRFCIDYRWKNKYIKDRIMLPLDLPGTMFNARNAKRYAKLDIIKAFHCL